MKKGKGSQKVRKSKASSKWFVESNDGQFVIDRCSDGGLVMVDRAQMNPDDDKDCQGMLCIMPEERSLFMEVMKKAVAMELLQDAKMCASDNCPRTVIVRKPK